jgi:hypothetical protein
MSDGSRDPEKNASRGLTLSAPRLAAAGDLPTVAAEGELLDQVGYGLTDRGESHLHVAVRCDVRHTSGKPQRMHEGVVQVDLGYALLASFG